MAENYFTRLDRYLGPQEENRFLAGDKVGVEGNGLSEPIMPISKLGATFGENTARGQPDIMASMVASIRQGSGVLQLAMQTHPGSGGVGSVTQSKREEIRDILKVSGVTWEGMEFNPEALNNLSGYDARQRMFSEQQRQSDIQHVKDAILFAGEIEAGGGIDIWSQEFHRGIGEASQNMDGKGVFVDFEGFNENEHAVKSLVDDRTGQIIQFSAAQTPRVVVPKWKTAGSSYRDRNDVLVQEGDYIDAEGNKLVPDANDPNFLMNRVPEWNEKTREFESESMNWDKFKQYAEERNKIEFANEEEYLTPEQWFQRVQMETQYMQQRGQSYYYTSQYQHHLDTLEHLNTLRDEALDNEQGLSLLEMKRANLTVSNKNQGTDEESYVPKSQVLTKQIEDTKQQLKHIHEAAGLADAQANKVWEDMEHIVPMDQYAKQRTFKSYAELGIFAMEETNRKNPVQPIYVGPELGFPQAYGGHPGEFIEIVEKSREEMIEQLKTNPTYRNKYDDDQIEEMAKKHIGGVLDTAHLSMWYNHFPKEKPDETEEARLKRFNNWYMEQMEKLGDADVIKNIQIVDSVTGNHRHLPVGEGIFPTVEAVKRLQEKGYDGAVVSEGHSEEGSDPGSIQYSLWRSFGASMGSSSGYFGVSQGGNSFGNVYTGMGGAAGYRAPPNYIVGAYNPSNEWKTWSETPLE